jgi:glycosyltransferase involved in cell wall biosynthesis
LLVPSRADNSPNVIHEAKLLGIPVIASSLDGISELLTPGYDVPISAAQLNVDGILEILLQLNPNHDKEIKKIMAHQFNEYVKDSVRSHINIYEGLVQRQLGAKTT